MTRMPRRWPLIVSGLVAAFAIGGATLILGAYDRYTLPSGSMEPTIRAGQQVWTRPSSGSDLGRGDAILFRSPPAPAPAPQSATVVSRVVGIGGDTVEAADGTLLVNGSPVEEPYLAADVPTPDIVRTAVPAGTVYVLGDNRSNSYGSWVFGPVPLENVEQRIVRVGGPHTLVIMGLVAFLALPFAMLAGRAALRRNRGEDRNLPAEYP